jgi:hypothetical protein
MPSTYSEDEPRVYRADGGRRSRALAVIVLVLAAIVIVLVGVAATSSAFDGSQGDTATFKLLPITTTTS